MNAVYSLTVAALWGAAICGADAATVSTKPVEPTGAVACDAVRCRDLSDTNTVFKPTYYSLEEWKARREWLRGQMRVAAGLWPEPARTPLNVHIFGRIEGNGYTIERVYFESYPGFYVTGNLYRPKPLTGRVPAVACPHGH